MKVWGYGENKGWMLNENLRTFTEIYAGVACAGHSWHLIIIIIIILAVIIIIVYLNWRLIYSTDFLKTYKSIYLMSTICFHALKCPTVNLQSMCGSFLIMSLKSPQEQKNEIKHFIIIKNSWKHYNLLVSHTDVNFPPSGKHGEAICEKTACSAVIPRICLNVSLWQPRWNMLACWIAKWLFLPALTGSSDEVGANHLSCLLWHLISAVVGGGAESVHSLVHSLTRSLTHSQLRSNTHKPIWHWEGKCFPFLTPITHEVLIPYDGCQSPAVYISSTLRRPLIFLSSLPCDYSFLFFLFTRAYGNQMVGAPFFLFSRMDGWMDRCRGHNVTWH